VQVNAYAQIAEACGYSPVTKLGLMYFEPQKLQELDDGLDTALMTDGFMMKFSPKYLEVECKPKDILQPLLKVARELVDIKEPPPSRKGCKDCELMERLIGEFGGTNNGSESG
jgi:hypothetical protein